MPTNQPLDLQSEQLLSTLATEQANGATKEIDRMTALEIAQVMNAEDARVAQAVQRELTHIARAIEEITQRLRQGGRLIYMGAGTSGRLGILDASECPPTFNVSPDLVLGCMAGGSAAIARSQEDIEDSTDAGKADAMRLHVTAHDAVVGIAASGRTPYVIGAVMYAREQGALTIGLACSEGTPLAAHVAIMITPLVGPEVITGSTRLKAGTAQKMVLNMLSTGTMVLLGKTFGNLMVDVQTKNYKLRQRALRLVQTIVGVDRERATTLLEEAGGDTKTAIVIGLTHVTADEARSQLAAHGHVLRSTLEAMRS